MKITIIAMQFPPHWIGGTEIATFHLATNLVKIGHEVDIITTHDKGLDKREVINNFTVHRLKCTPVKYFRFPLFILKSILIIYKIKPDVLHSQSTGRAGLAGLVSNRLLGIPFITWLRGADIYESSGISRSISNFIIRNTDQLIVLTDHMKNEAGKITDKNINVVPNGVNLYDADLFYNNSLKDRFNIPGKGKILVYVGKFRVEKGLKYLIMAMAIVGKRNSDVKLLLVGDGKERKELEKMVIESSLTNIIFAGEVSNKDVPKYLSLGDIFVLPSLSEGFPNAILEAFAAGLPVICTDVTGIHEIVKNGINGLLVKPTDYEDLAEKILYLAENENLLAQMRKNNSDEAKKYAWSNIIKDLESIYAVAVK
jgi:glycosyltransferase involved in cell wall biosynthesis